MRVVIKPAGIFILLAVVAILSAIAFWGTPHPTPSATLSAVPAVAGPIPSKDLLAEEKWKFVPNPEDMAQMQVKQESIPGVGEAIPVYTITMKKPAKDPWQVILTGPVSDTLVKQEPLRLVFRARSEKPSHFTANFEQNHEPYQKSLSQDVQVTPQWNQFTLPVLPIENYKPGDSQITFHCAFNVGTIQIADIHLYRSSN